MRKDGGSYGILIVDDSPKNIQLAAGFLRRDDYLLSFAQDGRTALDLVRTNPVDIILLDIMMPDMDGFAVLEELARDTSIASIPVICLTARTEKESIVRSLEMGAVDYITKPFDGAELQARVRTHLELKRAREEVLVREEALRREMEKTRVREQELLEVTRRLEEANRTLSMLSMIDGLTGIANRRQLDQALDREIRRCARERLMLSLIMMDIDHFKLYNDHYGHLAGDECLRRVAEVLSGHTRRPADLAARYGGEEFALILPETDRSGALAVAETIRRSVSALTIPHAAHPGSDRVTLSAGVVTLIPDAGAAPETVISRADSALYSAKRTGRDRVVSDSDI